MRNIKSWFGLRDALRSSRPFSWANTAIPFLVGFYLATGGLNGRGSLGLLYFIFPYNLLVYGVNDIYDYESDIKNPRKGSIEGALINKDKHRRLAIWIALLNVPIVGYLAWSGSMSERLILGATVFMAVAYSVRGLRFKEVAVLDSLTSACHFVLPLVFGLVLGGSSSIYPLAILSFGLWAVASHAFGAIQDIVYDRQAGIGSLATVFGVPRTTRLCFVAYVLSGIVAIVGFGWSGLFAACFIWLYAVNVARFFRYTEDSQSTKYNRGWKSFLWLNLLTGFWLTQLFLILLNPAHWTVENQVNLGAAAFLLIGLASLVVTLRNLSRLKPVAPRMDNPPKVSLLIPARNEAETIGQCLAAIEALDYPNLEVIILDDRSTDATRSIIEQFPSERVELMIGKVPPASWTGKNYACQQLAEAATGDYLLFMDADCQISSQAVTRLVSQAVAQNLGLLSVIPGNSKSTALAAIIHPITTYLLVGLQPLEWLRDHLPGYQPAYGAALLFKRSVYQQMGGHGAVKDRVAEDLAIAALVAQHHDYRLVSGADYVVSQHTTETRGVMEVELRRLYPCMRYNFTLCLALATAGIALAIGPIVALVFAVIFHFPMAGILASCALLVFMLSRFMIAMRQHEPLWSVFLHPVGMIIQMGFLVGSLLVYEFGIVRWRGNRLPQPFR